MVVLIKAFFNVLQVLNDLAFIEVVFLRVLSSELSTVASYESSTNKIKLLCYGDGMAKNFTNRFFIVTPEITDRVMIGHQLLKEPHEFNVSFAFPFQCS